MTQKVRRVSISADGEQGNDNNASDYSPSISADGRFIAVESDASNLIANDTNTASDVFLRGPLPLPANAQHSPR